MFVQSPRFKKMFGGTDSETGSAFGDGDFSAPPQLSDAEVRTIVAGWQVGQKFYVSFCTIDNPEPVLWTGQVTRRVGGLALNVEESTPLRLKVRYAQAPHSFWMPPDEGVIILGLGAGRPPFAPAAAAPAKIAPGKAGAKAATPPVAHAAKAPVPAPARAPRTAQQREEDAEALFQRIAVGVEGMTEGLRLNNAMLAQKMNERETAKKKAKKDGTIFTDPREWRFHIFNESDELVGDRDAVVASFSGLMASHFETHGSTWRTWALNQVKEELHAICRWGASAFEDTYLMGNAGRALWRLRSVAEIERNKLGGTGDSAGARSARATLLTKLMTVYETDMAPAVDELDIAVHKLIASEAGKKPPPKGKSADGSKTSEGNRICFKCKKPGHRIAECPEWQEGDRSSSSGNGSGVQRK
jgi:hypothetical protein